MKWFTPITIKEQKGYIEHNKPIMLMGSCFTDNIGARLYESKFDVDINPFGTLYNPLSLAHSIERLMEQHPFEAHELQQDGDLWYSYHHHGQFTHTSQQETLQHINSRYQHASEKLSQCSLLIITMGTAYTFRLKDSNMVVANCHKQPAQLFTRTRLTVEEITERWHHTLTQLKAYAPQCKVLFTVSPIRHISDGLHDNMLSKSTLLLAIDKLCSEHPDVCSYFPSYEIMMDELRDYRFYNEDMVHPSPQAIQHIYQRLTDAYFTDETRRLAERCTKISRGLQHRPLNGTSHNRYQEFARKLIAEMNEIESKYDYIDYEPERTDLQQLISQ